ncbi:hypothetical protein SDC9_190135 [bioreactor metagenome]|uniref:Uncharacterized protein n=1 Tax=bioreactor metagenome TaxID=1076179 RepID=A0A645HU69_9ZZZZ
MVVQQQRVAFLGRILQIPQFLRNERIVLRMNTEALIEGNLHSVRAPLPVRDFFLAQVQRMHQPLIGLSILGGELADHPDRQT